MRAITYNVARKKRILIRDSKKSIEGAEVTFWDKLLIVPDTISGNRKGSVPTPAGR